MAHSKPEVGYVYLIRRDDGWYRIGCTTHPAQRFRYHRWENRDRGDLIVLCLADAPDPRSAERMLHSVFADKRTGERHRGLGVCKEWFRLTEDDLVRFSTWIEIVGTHVRYVAIELSDKGWLKRLRGVLDAD